MATLRWGASTDVGRIRSSNEDAYVVKPNLFVVADGMGGHLAGEVASALAVSTIDRRLGTTSPNDVTIEALSNAVQQANDAIFRESQTDHAKLGMGTTVTAIVVTRAVENDDGAAESFAIANVGDSRAYAFRGDRLVQLSIDHSYVQELIATGQIEPEEARTHPNRNIVTKALGIELGVEPDIWTLPIVAGDRLMLCSDGLVDEVADDAIASILRAVDDPQDAAEELVAAANVNGGRDNVTVVVIDVIAVEQTEQAKSESDAAAEKKTAEEYGPVPRRVSAALQPSGSIAVDADADAEISDDADLAVVGSPVAARTHAADSTIATKRPASTPSSRQAASVPVPKLVKDASKPIPRPKQRRIGIGTVLFSAAVLAVFVVAVVFTAAQARSGYFVGLRGDEIVVYKGKPGGMLWFDPTVEVDTTKKRTDVTPDQLAQIERQPTFDDVSTAVKYVQNLAAQAAPTTTTTPATTTPPTTVAATTTAPATTLVGG